MPRKASSERENRTEVNAELRDVLLVLAAAHERALIAALLNLVQESKRAASVLDATAETITRERLVGKTRIDRTNLSKVTGPLVAMGWVRAHNAGGGITYRRSPVVDYLLKGKTVGQWQEAALARFPRPSG